MPGEQVGSAYAKVSLDSSDFDSGLNSAKGKFSSFASDMEGRAGRLGSALGNALKVGVLAGAAAIGGAVVGGTKAFADYEQGLANIQKIAGTTDAETKNLGSSLRSLSGDTGIAVTSLEGLASALASAGVAKDQLLETSKGVAIGAKALGLDPEAIATDFGKISNIYQLTGADANKFFSMVNELENEGVANGQQLLTGLAEMAPLYVRAGGSLQQYAAIQATGIGLGMQTNEIYTQLNSALDQTMQNRANITEGAKLLNVTEEKYINMLKTDGINTMFKLNDAVKKHYNSVDAAVARQRLFGAVGGKSIDLLSGKMDQLNKYTETSNKAWSEGVSAQEEFGRSINTIWGQWDRMKAKIVDVGISIGELTSGPFKEFLLFMNDKAIPAVKEFLEAFAKGDWEKVGDMIQSGIRAGWEKLKDLGGQLLGWLKEVDWSGVGSFIVAGIKGAWAELQNLGSQLLGWLKGVDWAGVGSAIVAHIEESWNQLKALGSKLLGWLKAVDWASVGKKAADAFQTAWDALKGLGKKVAGWIETQGGWNALGVKTATAITDAWTAFKGWSTPITSNLKEGFENWAGGSEPIAWGQKLGKALVDGIKYIFGGLGGAAGGGGSLLSDIIDWHMAGYEAGAKFALGFASALAVGIAEALNSINTEIKIPSWLNPAGKEETINIGMGTKQLEDIKKYWADKGGTSSPYSPPSYSSGAGGYGSGASAPTIEGLRSTGGSGALVSSGRGMSLKITTGYDKGSREEIGIKEWVKQQADKGVEWKDLKAELYKLGEGSALTMSDVGFLQSVYDTATASQEEVSDIQIRTAEKAADITTEAAEESGETAKDAAKESADTTEDAAKEASETSKKSTEWAASKWTGLADVMSYAAQTASSSISSTATAAANTLTAAAQNSLTIGNAIASKMQGAGDAVKIGLDTAGRQIAVIGQVAQSQFAAAGGQFVGSATQAGTITTGAATRASSIVQGVTSGFSQAGSTVSNGLNAGANALQGAAGAVTSAANAMRSGSDWVRNLGTTYQTTGVSKGKTTGNYPTWMTDAVPWLAEGKETSGPELAVIGEEGKEFVIPTKTKRWDLLLAAMRAYGIRGMADGGTAGTGGASSGEADQMQAYFGIQGLASMSKSVQKIINDLKDFFRISWSIIKAEGSTYWKSINAIITAEATTTRNNAWQAALDIRNTWLSSNQQIVADATTTYAAMWPAIEPGVKSIHDGIIYSFQDSGSQVKSLMDQMGSDAMISLTSFQTSWNTVWQQMLADLQSTASQITGILTDLGAKVGSITVNASVNVAGGGAGSYGGSADMTGSGGGGGGSDGAIINTNGTANFTDTTCTGDLVLVNALKYTNPNGQTSYINPLTYLETGGISNYQSSGYGGSGGITPSSSGAGYSGGMATAYGSGFSWGAKGALIDTPQRVIVGEKGPELILPAKLTRMFLNLAEGGGTGPGEARPIVIEDHTSHHWYLDGREVTNQIMERATKQLRLKGAIATR